MQHLTRLRALFDHHSWAPHGSPRARALRPAHPLPGPACGRCWCTAAGVRRGRGSASLAISLPRRWLAPRPTACRRSAHRPAHHRRQRGPGCFHPQVQQPRRPGRGVSCAGGIARQGRCLHQQPAAPGRPHGCGLGCGCWAAAGGQAVYACSVLVAAGNRQLCPGNKRNGCRHPCGQSRPLHCRGVCRWGGSRPAGPLCLEWWVDAGA